MLASAYADGVLDACEQRAVHDAIVAAGVSEDERRMLTNQVDENETLDFIAKAAETPHHAATLYAAAVVAAGDLNEKETVFLSKLAARLDLDETEASSIRASAKE